MFVFLFEPTTGSLNLPSFFRRIHTNLLPLYKPLLLSTSPTNIARRLESVVSPSLLNKTSSTTSSTSGTPTTLATNPIYDLIYSPVQMTIHSSIPNIPLPNTLAAHGIPTAPTSATPYITQTWTRIEALNVHAQILASWIATRKRGGGGAQGHKGERERSARTGKGWWVCWLRIEVNEEPPHDIENQETSSPETKAVHDRPGMGETIMSYETQRHASYQEAVLIRKATGAADASGPSAGRSFSGMSFGAGAAVSRWTGGYLGSSVSDGDKVGSAGKDGSKTEAGSATYGLGVDARRYVESLLSLNR